MERKIPLVRQNRINREILSKKVRLIGIDGKQIGIVNIDEAIKISEEVGYDLVEINPHGNPPVCKIINYGKFLYEKRKFLKKQKKRQKIIQIKEVKFRPTTEEHDYQVKIRSLTRFLKEGNKVRVIVRFRGREITHQKIGLDLLTRIREDLYDLSSLETSLGKLEGRQMIMILSPKK